MNKSNTTLLNNENTNGRRYDWREMKIETSTTL